MTLKLLALAGRKQSGKDSIGQFLVNYVNNESQSIAFYRDHNYKLPAKSYWWATPLKEFCIDYLAVPRTLVYGTNEDKNCQVEHLTWERFPDQKLVYDLKNSGLTCNGPMTVREVLQYWGSNILRKAWPDVWTTKCIKDILSDNSVEFATINDTRFPNEVETIHKQGGKAIKLTRCSFPQDKHISETSLDKENFDWNQFDAVVDNANMSVEQTNQYVLKLVKNWGFV